MTARISIAITELGMSGTDKGPTIFDKILDGSIPADFIHQDDKCVAFKDVNPQAPVHFLVIPRKRIAMIEEAEDGDGDLLGHLMLIARKVAKEQGLDKGYRYCSLVLMLQYLNRILLLELSSIMVSKELSLYTIFTFTYWEADR